MVVEPVRSNVPLVFLMLFPKVMVAAPLEVSDELAPFFVYEPTKVMDPVETVMVQFLSLLLDAPCDIVPPTVRMPLPTARVIVVGAELGWAAKFPLQERVPPLKVTVMFAPATVGLKVTLPHDSVTPGERLMS